MNIFNLFKNGQNHQEVKTNAINNSDYPESIFTNNFSNEIKDEKNYKMQKDFVNRNVYANPLSQNTNTFYEQSQQNNDTKNGLFGNMNIQSLLPLLMGGKANLMQMLTKSNPEMASVLNILGNKTKKEEPNNNKDSQNFDMTNFVKCSDYFKK